MIEQRLGESNEAYEARKKRVKRTRQSVDTHFAHGHGGNSIPAGVDACIKESTDGTWYGYEQGSFGSIQQYNPGPVIMHTTKWHADGTIEVRFGANGDEQLSGLGSILFIYQGQGLLLTWDAGNTRYFLVDTNTTGFLIQDFTEFKRRCFSIEQSTQEAVTHTIPLLEDVTHNLIVVTHPVSITIQI